MQSLGTAKARSKVNSPEVGDFVGKLREPRLAMEKTGWRKEFASSLKTLVSGPAAPKAFLGDPYFRDCWIDQRFPKFAFATAIALQIILILFPPPIWNLRPPRVVAPPPEMELTWYGPVKDLPAILPAGKVSKPAPRAPVSKTAPVRGADAFHPRQIILSQP